MSCKTLSVLFVLQILLLFIPNVDNQDIVGGLPVKYGEFRYMAALGWLNENAGLDFLCGGVIISVSSRWILTAAHCTHKNGKQPDYAYLGGQPLDEFSFSGNLTYTVKQVIVHPKYDPKQAYHDIALIELYYRFPEYIGFGSICVWRRRKLTSNETVAIGYGQTEFAGKTSKELLKVNLKVYSNEICQPFYKRQRKYKSGISDKQICAGDKEDTKDTCQGDSGGPLLLNYNNVEYVVGITSTGQACSGYPPAIYTKVSPYRRWIRKALYKVGGHVIC
ncbi:serine protease snake-like [Eupeodes corollae]|uniref:serine protease snake-like n=1 Tax=Eupeodes corollae TaxID=290404 RepID=UPI002491CE50|nr:serine protease snake-like [Eupeodes corollae]